MEIFNHLSIFYALEDVGDLRYDLKQYALVNCPNLYEFKIEYQWQNYLYEMIASPQSLGIKKTAPSSSTTTTQQNLQIIRFVKGYLPPDQKYFDLFATLLPNLEFVAITNDAAHKMNPQRSRSIRIKLDNLIHMKSSLFDITTVLTNPHIYEENCYLFIHLSGYK